MKRKINTEKGQYGKNEERRAGEGDEDSMISC